MLWTVTGVDPRKRKADNGRILIEDIEAATLVVAVITYCKKYPNIVQLAIVEKQDEASSDI